ncbi:elongation factor 1-gamma-like isoform X2 [Pelobates fuscus]|uniref:elongation factor 1-gamma-like isoform X2 n=1 Tax=Pelobates fuscus TaxID=191477 RepID=UPI002FE487EB
MTRSTSRMLGTGAIISSRFAGLLYFEQKPKYVEEDGLTLHGYECIVFYIALDCLQGVGLREKSLIQLWLRFVEKEIVPLLYVWVYPIIGLLPYYEQATERAKLTFKKVMSVLETHLRTRTYMIGERLSIADVVIVSALVLPYMLVFDPIFRKPYISVNRWFTTCVNNAAFVEALGNVALCEETRHYEEGKPLKISLPLHTRIKSEKECYVVKRLLSANPPQRMLNKMVIPWIQCSCTQRSCCHLFF